MGTSGSWRRARAQFPQRVAVEHRYAHVAGEELDAAAAAIASTAGLAAD